MKKLVRLAIVDFAYNESYLVERLLNGLSDRYDFNITEDKPDFVLHSCFGHRVLLFDGVRIFFSAENCLPDFNISDYAIGMHRLSLGDRYLRLPLYRLYPETYARLLKLRNATASAKRSEFCTCVVSNAEREFAFETFFRLLSAYRPVRSGGKLYNNVGGCVPDKITFMQQGRFGLAIENSSAPGYITEKITDVFAAQAVPIYWGAPDISSDFNPQAFINLNDYASPEAAVTAIRAIDNDPQRYAAMLLAPVFAEGKEPESLRADRVVQFLASVFDRDRQAAYRRNRIAYGRRYERMLATAFFKPHVQMAHLLRDKTRKFRKIKTFNPRGIQFGKPACASAEPHP